MANVKVFRDYCARHDISEREGMLGALEMVIPFTGKGPAQRVLHSVLEVRSFRPEVLLAVFDIDHEGIPSLMAHADKVERAHAIWTEANG